MCAVIGKLSKNGIGGGEAPDEGLDVAGNNFGASTKTERNTCIFQIEKSIRVRGGFDPCFLYEGRVQPQASSASIGTQGISLFAATDKEQEAQFPSFLKDKSLENRPLTLYISYDQPSPKIDTLQPQTADIAPYRFALRDSDDDTLLSSYRGMPTEVHVDEDLCMVVWGEQLSLLFPSLQDLRSFCACLRQITIRRASLATHPCASMLINKHCVVSTTPHVSTSISGSCTGVLGSVRIEDAASDADSPPPHEEWKNMQETV